MCLNQVKSWYFATVSTPRLLTAPGKGLSTVSKHPTQPGLWDLLVSGEVCIHRCIGDDGSAWLHLYLSSGEISLPVLDLCLQDKLYQEDYQQVVAEEEKEQILTSLKEASDWMDEEGYAAGTKLLREKLSQLKNLCKDMFFRVEERRKWPDRLAALNNLLNTSMFFLR